MQSQLIVACEQMKLIPAWHKKKPTGEDQVSYKLLNLKSTHQQQRQQSAWRRNQNIATWEPKKQRRWDLFSEKFKRWSPSHTCWVLKLWEGYRIWFFSSSLRFWLEIFFFSFSLFTYLSHSFAFVFWIFFSGRNKIYTKFIYIFLWTASRLFYSLEWYVFSWNSLFFACFWIYIYIFISRRRKIRSGCVPPDAALCCCCDCRKKDNKNTAENRGPERLSMFLSELHF